MKSKRKTQGMVVATTLLAFAPWAQAFDSKKKVPVDAKADLQVVSEVMDFKASIVEIADETKTATALGWVLSEDPANPGEIKNPGDGSMNSTKWTWSKHKVKVSYTVTKPAPFAIQVYTNNRNLDITKSAETGPDPRYTQAGQQFVNGLVSQTGVAKGKFRLPMTWRLTQSPRAITQTCDTKKQGVTPAFASVPQMCEVRADNSGFEGFDTHFFKDQADANLVQKNPDGTLVQGSDWWNSPTNQQAQKAKDDVRNYVAVLQDFNGSFLEANNAFTASSPVHLYVGAQFAGVVKSEYATQLILELYNL